MIVRMRAAISGTRNGEDWPPIGGTVELPDDEAADLCAAGLAIPEPDTAVRTATPTEDKAGVEKRTPRGKRG